MKKFLALAAAIVMLLLVVAGSMASSAAPAPAVQYFAGLSNNAHARGLGVVIAIGPIHARGRDVVVNRHTDRFVFPRGTITLTHRRRGQHNHVDRVTCYFTHTEHGFYKVTSGTGAYTGASGHGKYKLAVSAVQCRGQRNPRIFQLHLFAAGPMRA